MPQVHAGRQVIGICGDARFELGGVTGFQGAQGGLELGDLGGSGVKLSRTQGSQYRVRFFHLPVQQLGAGTAAANVPDGTRAQLLEGTWNATAVLLEGGDAIERTAQRLPYASGFRADA